MCAHTQLIPVATLLVAILLSRINPHSFVYYYFHAKLVLGCKFFWPGRKKTDLKFVKLVKTFSVTEKILTIKSSANQMQTTKKYNIWSVTFLYVAKTA